MKYLFLNLKRFDVPPEFGGVNRLAPIASWGRFIVEKTGGGLKQFADRAEFVQFFPEAHLLAARAALTDGSPIRLGCQGVFRSDLEVGGNFGAFTSSRPAAAARALGCDYALIGHCEERNALAGVYAEAGLVNPDAVSRILNGEAKQAVKRGMKILYCIGEKSEEQDRWEEVLGRQLELGLAGIPAESVVIGYEPVWSIGPGKTPAGRDYIEKVARFVKQRTGGLPVVYGGGLKKDNAAMLAGIPEIDGGLIALTRFTGEIGFYPDEYLEIIQTYLAAVS